MIYGYDLSDEQMAKFDSLSGDARAQFVAELIREATNYVDKRLYEFYWTEPRRPDRIGQRVRVLFDVEVSVCCSSTSLEQAVPRFREFADKAVYEESAKNDAEYDHTKNNDVGAA